MNNTSYDLIGDIHGQASELLKLLAKLAYKNIDGIWQHSERKIIFLGDFIDAGDQQSEVVNIVRPMIENNHAYAVMGNHEYNAIAYYTKNTDGSYLRPHTESNINQHQKFLEAYKSNDLEYANTIKWFKTLPLWLELDSLRVVHACWDEESIRIIRLAQQSDSFLDDELLQASSTKNTPEYNAIETILKGKEESLPEGEHFTDNYGKIRTKIRTKWWESYPTNSKPVFFGHYWMNNNIEPLSTNTACIDYSVARQGGKLVAYRWDGEQTLSKDKMVFVNRVG